MGTFSIRDAAAEDIERIGEIHFAARWWAYHDFLPEAGLAAQDPALMANWWRERIAYEVPPHRMRVVTGGDKSRWLAGRAHHPVLGFCYSGPSDWGESATGMVNALHVDPAWHGNGLGRRLLEDALAAMRDHGWQQARLWVLTANQNARKFYEHHGWRPTGDTRDDFVGGVPTEQMRYGVEIVSAHRGGPAGPAG